LRELGANEVLDYHEPGYESLVKDLDAIVDLVGGEEQVALVDALRPGGTFVGVPGGASAELIAAAEANGAHGSPFLVQPDGAALDRIAVLIDSGAVRVEVAQTFPLDQVGAAHTVGETNRTRGKLVLLVRS